MDPRARGHMQKIWCFCQACLHEANYSADFISYFLIPAHHGSSTNTLSYESQVSEVLWTEDGSSLDADCVRAYTDAADDKASFMMSAIETELSRSACLSSVSSATYAHSIGIFENQVLIIKKY